MSPGPLPLGQNQNGSCPHAVYFVAPGRTGSRPERFLWFKPPPPIPGTMEKQGQNKTRWASSNQELCCQDVQSWANSLPVATAVVMAVGAAVALWIFPDLRWVSLSPTVSGNGNGECWVSQWRHQQTGRQHTAGSQAGSGCTQIDWTEGDPCCSIFHRNLLDRNCLFKAWAPWLEKMTKRGSAVTVRFGQPQPLSSSRPEKEWQPLCFPLLL